MNCWEGFLSCCLCASYLSLSLSLSLRVSWDARGAFRGNLGTVLGPLGTVIRPLEAILGPLETFLVLGT